MGGTTVPRLLTDEDVATIVAEAERSLPFEGKRVLLIRGAGISCARSADWKFEISKLRSGQSAQNLCDTYDHPR
jgi:hypothetical protein